MMILPDGSVPACREFVLEADCGNVFTEGVDAVWKKMGSLAESHIQGVYPGKCENCDEYYTFNF